MAANSGIEWTDATFNPWRGCTKVSEACRSCYAETWAARNPAVFGVWGPMGTRVVAAEATWKEPVKWNKAAQLGYCIHCNGRGTKSGRQCPACAGEGELGRDFARVFCASLADIFENWTGAMIDSEGRQLWYKDQPNWWTVEPGGRVLDMEHVRHRTLRTIEQTPYLRWLLLTKRPENIRPALELDASRLRRVGWEIGGNWSNAWILNNQPPANVWLGTTVEDRANLWRIDELRNVPAVVRFLSVEPMLEDLGELNLAGIHWVIVGGESGRDARPTNPKWVTNLRDQCQAAGVAFFFKQWGEWWPTLVDGVDRGSLIKGSGVFLPDGRFVDPYELDSPEAPKVDFASLVHMDRIGKDNAGRKLYGETWSQYPA